MVSIQYSEFFGLLRSKAPRNACPHENGGRLIGSPLLWGSSLRGRVAAEAIYSFVREEKV
ncbi:MAG: hypothetical protein BGO67_06485 [Alphaproteobacteria bacterium 41-28]|nr:MAG: hypothetical protein BGO67_06485 [Alphaproteobacteria bacterium 41-28]